jgi:probable non-F420 flavinoid oxidoreductase
MALIGYHASHEQHRPRDLVRHARAAEDAGFLAASSSDHFTPWSRAQGESGAAWSWLGAAMQTTSVPFGVVCAPGQRYHPAIVAQAIATLLDLFPGRLWVAMGSGEASNEHITGDRWPPKPTRNERLLACVEVIRALLRGEEVSVDGHVRVDRAQLWTLPPAPPELYGAALSEETARWCGRWADGLLTVHYEPARLRRLVDAFRDGGGDGKPVVVQAKVAYGQSDEEALAGAYEQWRTNVFEPPLMADLETVDEFEAAAEHVPPAAVAEVVMCSADLGVHLEFLHGLLECGVDDLYIHHVPRPQAAFVDAYGSKVLPELTGASGRPATSGGRAPSSTASTSRRSSTGTATAWATSPVSPSASTTSPVSASACCG